MALPPLPAEVLSLICTEALQCGTSPATLLTLNSRWHEVTSSILYSCLTIPACSVLLSATSATGQEDCCSTANVWVNRLRGKLHAITQNHVYAGKVKAFYILPKDWLSLGHLPTCVKHVEENHLQTRTTGTELDDASTHTSDAVTESEILELIMNHLTGIHSLSWLLLRPPSATFMATLQNACIRMLYLDIITCPGDLLQNSAIHATDCSPLFIKTSTIGSSPALRWDLASLQTLDARYLVHLTLQNLSLEGIRTLGQLSSALVSCEELSICNTLFVDDILLSAVSGAMPKLGALRIKHMAGTKLTSKGIASVMESSEALQEFEMLDVQGEISI